MELIPRRLETRLREALADTRVTALTGPRQAGKTTLVRAIALDQPSSTYITLDDEATLAAAEADPRAFVEGRPGLLVIDEVQRAPRLLRAIKTSVDRDPRPGRFLLTGSTNLFAVPKLSETLAGRMELLQLGPLAQEEMEGLLATFVETLLGAELEIRPGLDLDKRDYLERACAGGFPDVFRRPADRRRPWFESYLTETTQHEVRDVADLSRIGELPRLMRLIAARHASPLNVADLARDARIPERTAHRYLDVLEAVFLIRRIPAWSRNLTSRESHRPKVMLVDSGLAAHLRGASPSALARPEIAQGTDGPLLEGFVLGELDRQIGWSRLWPRLYHFRDREGLEVDAIIEVPDGRVAGIEVKSSGMVGPQDFHALTVFRDRLGNRFAGGVVLYTGSESLSFGDRLIALPIGAIWRYQ